MLLPLAFSLSLVGGLALQAPKTITFPSSDGLTITADLYAPHPKSAPFIVLFHQAEASRGEYLEIAPRLNQLGFNCLAVDQRSGGGINGVANETFARARKAGRKTDFLDAEPDMVAALKYARKQPAQGPIIAWGSSYSAALVLRLAGTTPRLADGVVAFAPGEYFQGRGGGRTYVTSAARKLSLPVFITSARSERDDWMGIYDAIPSHSKTSFLPDSEGLHGSSALWASTAEHAEYWKAVEAFLRANWGL